MKILVVSDTHRQMEKMRLAVQLEQPDMVLHLGDHDSDAIDLGREKPNLPIAYVQGNCDRLLSQSAMTYLRKIGGVQIFAVHGHQYDVKNGLLRLRYAAMEHGAQVCLFGHTHRAYCENLDGLWLMNPGACGGYRPTYGILEIQNGGVHCQIREGTL